MATTKVLGKVSLTLGGDYSDAVSYSRLTMVLAADGKGYVSKQDNTVGIEPAVTAGWENYWQLVTERGAGVTSIQKTASGETSDTYTIYYENGTTSTYQAENGKGYVADVTRSLGDDFSIMTGAYSVIDGAGWTDGYYLKNNGVVNAASGMKVMALTSVAEGTYTVAIRETAPFGAVASRVCGYDANGDFVRQLATFDIPTAATVAKKTIDTTGCAQIRISACSHDAVAVYAGQSIAERVTAVETAQGMDNAPVILNTATGAAVCSFADGADDLPMELHIGIEPVQAGSGDPSPTNVRAITGWTGCNVVRTGKNLFNAADATAKRFIKSTGEESVSDNWSVSAFIQIKSGATYVLSGVTNAGTSAYHAFYDAGKTFISAVASTTYVLNAPAGAAFIRVSMKTETPSGVQLETGSTPTAFSPYAGATTLSVTFPSGAGTVYGGELTVNRDGSGVLVVDRVTLDLDSTSTWTKSSTYLGSFYKNRSAFSPPVPAYDVVNIICSHAARVNSISQYASGKLFIDGSVNLWLMSESASLQDWYDYLDAQKTGGTPVQLCYTIASPSTIPLTPGQVKTLLGHNCVWADTGNTGAAYPADTKLYIDGKIAELQALILENT